MLATLPGMSAQTIELFDNPNPRGDWSIVNDSVMGGISQSQIQTNKNAHLEFSGNLSLANNGGFASVRSRATQLDLGNNSTLQLEVNGDGRSYQIDLRSRNTRMAGSFRATFETTGSGWQKIEIPMNQFIAQSFGRPYPNIRFNPQEMNSIGFTLSDKKPGPFRLEIKRISVLKPEITNNPIAAVPDNPPVALITTAIQKGVPLFNEGNPQACAAIYEVACIALASMPQAPSDLKNRLDQALAQASNTEDPSRQAWILRYALDDALDVFASPPE